jgi:hypothetical protein
MFISRKSRPVQQCSTGIEKKSDEGELHEVGVARSEACRECGAETALPFVVIDDDVIAGTPVRCINERAAIMCAQRLLTVFGNVGSVALRRSSVSGETLDVLQAFGDVPMGSDLIESSLRKDREASIGH